jgi:hypothetical protein
VALREKDVRENQPFPTMPEYGFYEGEPKLEYPLLRGIE